MNQTYNEFRVSYYNNKIASKEQTKRGTVRITEADAKTNNLYSLSTGLVYELVPEVLKEIDNLSPIFQGKIPEKPKVKRGRKAKK